MDIDPLDVAKGDDADDASFAQFRKLNQFVAITIALLATFMGICKVKDDNIVQAMQQSQANKLDHWSFYQARNVREEVAKGTLVQLRLAASTAPAAAQDGYRNAVASYEAVVADQHKKKEELRLLA